ncbi:PHP domain-like protein [Ascobolus immersus RN42]|uniref:PHP domain-like protein n=1 Tax=Ascobolus immersus RN42 TaxID=1160509 RepID=A0A3N4IHM5_ASCIM|nr:PHP domain-like protein [Ascobolus immersus RN42]
MFYDLNVPYNPEDAELPRTIGNLVELGYRTIALTVTLTGKIPPDHVCPIPSNPFPQYPEVRFLTRCLLVCEDTSQIHQRPTLTTSYDILSIRPLNDKVLQQIVGATEYDLISVDISQRLSFLVKHKAAGTAFRRGLKWELCYNPTAENAESRRYIIQNSQQIIRALRDAKRGGIIITSGATKSVAVRAPHEAINFGVVLGLKPEIARLAIEKECKEVVRMAEARRRSWRGAVEAIDTIGFAESILKKEREENNKRKAEEEAADDSRKKVRKTNGQQLDEQPSKRQQKKANKNPKQRS